MKERNTTNSELTIGQRCADFTCRQFGSWWFCFGQALFFAIWMIYNKYSHHPFDPAPWFLLNLLLSFSAAFANPLLQISQNRAADRDRTLARLHYELSKKQDEQLELIVHRLEELETQTKKKS